MARGAVKHHRDWRRWARISLALSALVHLFLLVALELTHAPDLFPPRYRIRLEPLSISSEPFQSLVPDRLPIPTLSSEGEAGPGQAPSFGMEGGFEGQGPAPGMAGVEGLPLGAGAGPGEKAGVFVMPALPAPDLDARGIEKLRQEEAEREQYARFHLLDADTTDEESRRQSRAKQIIERAIAAMGGREALGRIGEMKARVWIEANEHCVTIPSLPPRIDAVAPYAFPVAQWTYRRGTFTIQPITPVVSFNPDVPNTIALVRDPCLTQPRYYQLFESRWAGYAPPGAPAIARLREQGEAARWHFIDHFLGEGVEIYYLTSEEFENPYPHHERDLGSASERRQVDVVQVVDERYGQLQEAFFDEETGLLLALREGLTAEEQRWHMRRYAKEPPVWTTIYGNYQPIHGVLTPHRLVRGSSQLPGAVAIHLRIAYHGEKPDLSEPDMSQ